MADDLFNLCCSYHGLGREQQATPLQQLYVPYLLYSKHLESEVQIFLSVALHYLCPENQFSTFERGINSMRTMRGNTTVSGGAISTQPSQARQPNEGITILPTIAEVLRILVNFPQTQNGNIEHNNNNTNLPKVRIVITTMFNYLDNETIGLFLDRLLLSTPPTMRTTTITSIITTTITTIWMTAIHDILRTLSSLGPTSKKHVLDALISRKMLPNLVIELIASYLFPLLGEENIETEKMEEIIGLLYAILPEHDYFQILHLNQQKLEYEQKQKQENEQKQGKEKQKQKQKQLQHEQQKQNQIEPQQQELTQQQQQLTQQQQQSTKVLNLIKQVLLQLIGIQHQQRMYFILPRTLKVLNGMIGLFKVEFEPSQISNLFQLFQSWPNDQSINTSILTFLIVCPNIIK